jgi:hypothetical protein
MLGKTEIKIDTNIPFPGLPGEGSRRYPFNKLEVGHSFEKPHDVEEAKFRTAAFAYAKKHGIRLSVRKTDSGIRCWRVA